MLTRSNIELYAFWLQHVRALRLRTYSLRLPEKATNLRLSQYKRHGLDEHRFHTILCRILHELWRPCQPRTPLHHSSCLPIPCPHAVISRSCTDPAAGFGCVRCCLQLFGRFCIRPPTTFCCFDLLTHGANTNWTGLSCYRLRGRSWYPPRLASLRTSYASHRGCCRIWGLSIWRSRLVLGPIRSTRKGETHSCI
jgi:hypothetical protein